MLRPGDHASTFGGNPFACGLALSVCHIVESEYLLANAAARCQQLRQGLHQLVNIYPHLFEQVRGWGLINGLVLKTDAPLKSIDIVKAAMPQGLLLVPAGPSVVRFVPPLTVGVTDIDEALEKLSMAVRSLS